MITEVVKTKQKTQCVFAYHLKCHEGAMSVFLNVTLEICQKHIVTLTFIKYGELI